MPAKATPDHRTLVESLEPRVLLSTLTVTTSNDSGTGSLRQAITDANDAPVRSEERRAGKEGRPPWSPNH